MSLSSLTSLCVVSFPNLGSTTVFRRPKGVSILIVFSPFSSHLLLSIFGTLIFGLSRFVLTGFTLRATASFGLGWIKGFDGFIEATFGACGHGTTEVMPLARRLRLLGILLRKSCRKALSASARQRDYTRILSHISEDRIQLTGVRVGHYILGLDPELFGILGNLSLFARPNEGELPSVLLLKMSNCPSNVL